MTKYRPILFNAEMVCATLAGRKTQTRRIVRDKDLIVRDHHGKPISDVTPELLSEQNGVAQSQCPYGQIGDRLWVRETFWRWGRFYRMHCPAQTGEITNEWEWHGEDIIGYVADHPKAAPEKDKPCENEFTARKIPSIHMPRWASRITLEITDIRVERLQDISEEDAQAEGISCVSKDGHMYKYGVADSDGFPGNDDFGWKWQDWQLTAKDAFKNLWKSINGEDSWNANPWVWVIEFKHLKGGE